MLRRVRLQLRDFSILGSARALASVILAGKGGSCRLSTTSFSANVVVAKRYQNDVRSFIILRSGESVTSFTKGNSANFSSEKW